MHQIIFRQLVVLLAILSLSSCASNKRAEIIRDPDRPYKVTVSTGGKEIQDYQKKLVHRISISEEEVKQIRATWIADRTLPNAQLSFTLDNELAGIVVLKSTDKLSLNRFGLRKNDLIIAIGVRRTSSIGDLFRILDTLEKEGNISLSLARKGEVHKVIYYLSKGGDR